MKDKNELLSNFLIKSLEFHEKNMKDENIEFIINFTGNLLAKLTCTLSLCCFGDGNINAINSFIDEIAKNTKMEVNEYIKEQNLKKH